MDLCRVLIPLLSSGVEPAEIGNRTQGLLNARAPASPWAAERPVASTGCHSASTDRAAVISIGAEAPGRAIRNSRRSPSVSPGSDPR